MPTTPDRPDATAARRFTQRVAAQRDAEIRNTALSCFNEHGCFRTDLDTVAAQVGIGKGTLYRHYSSKHELLANALQTGIDRLVAHCERVQSTPGADPLRAVVGELIALNRAKYPASPSALHRLVCSCLWSGVPINPTMLSTALAPVVARWQQHRGADVGSGGEWMAAVLLALINMPEAAGFGAGHGDATALQPADVVAERIVNTLRHSFDVTL